MYPSGDRTNDNCSRIDENVEFLCSNVTIGRQDCAFWKRIGFRIFQASEDVFPFTKSRIFFPSSRLINSSPIIYCTVKASDTFAIFVASKLNNFFSQWYSESVYAMYVLSSVLYTDFGSMDVAHFFHFFRNPHSICERHLSSPFILGRIEKQMTK